MMDKASARMELFPDYVVAGGAPTRVWLTARQNITKARDRNVGLKEKVFHSLCAIQTCAASYRKHAHIS